MSNTNGLGVQRVWVGEDHMRDELLLVVRQGNHVGHLGAADYIEEGGSSVFDERRIPLRLNKDSATRISQSLWDLGYRPRDALNHDEAIKHLKSEVEFLRGLVLRTVPEVQR